MDHHAPRSFEVAVQYSSLQKMIRRKLAKPNPTGLPLNPDVVRRTLKRRQGASVIPSSGGTSDVDAIIGTIDF
jgi:hypothetical protein